jgi:hypothetical protein
MTARRNARRWRSRLTSIVTLLAAAPATAAPPGLGSDIVIGTDAQGHPVNPPVNAPASTWTEANPWNGKAARFNDATARLAFEAVREDIVGGDSATPPAPAAASARRSANPLSAMVFDARTAADPVASPIARKRTASIYVSGPDGRGAVCLACSALQDGVDGVVLVRAPSAGGRAFERLAGARIYAVQNKDNPTWHPSGDWLFAAVEMPRHAGPHLYATGEAGLFTDIYAVYVRPRDPRFGKIWVQLTDWRSTWGPLADDLAPMPLDASEPACPTGDQYSRRPGDIPFAYFSCSAQGRPPPTSGVMRPTTSARTLANGDTPIAWGARVGVNSKPLLLAGVLFQGTAVVRLEDSHIAGLPPLPSLEAISGPLAPTQVQPDGRTTYLGRQAATPIGLVGQWYEPWSMSDDGLNVYYATDAFLSGHPGPAKPTTDSVLFMDVAERPLDGRSVRDLTAYDPAGGYGYVPSASPAPERDWGYWEEPAVFVAWRGRRYLAFASNAGMPKFDLSHFNKTFGLDPWLRELDLDRTRQIAWSNDPASAASSRIFYPTGYSASSGRLYLSDVPAGFGGDNPPSNIRVMDLGAALDHGLMR